MTPDRKKPGVAFWASVVLVVGLAYPLSIGPAGWITSRAGFPSAVPTAYRPILLAVDSAPGPVQRFVYRYADVFAPRGHHFLRGTDEYECPFWYWAVYAWEM
jgi:hypothetical protein